MWVGKKRRAKTDGTTLLTWRTTVARGYSNGRGRTLCTTNINHESLEALRGQAIPGILKHMMETHKDFYLVPVHCLLPIFEMI